MAPSDPIKTGSTPLPLAHLRRGPGRPRTRPRGDIPGDIHLAAGPQVRANAAEHGHGPEATVASGRSLSRLLDRAAAADYLSVSVDVLDRLTRQGHLRRRVLPGTRCIRFDVRDLDRVIESS
jgi:hypothetical protein